MEKSQNGRKGFEPQVIAMEAATNTGPDFNKANMRQKLYNIPYVTYDLDDLNLKRIWIGGRIFF